MNDAIVLFGMTIFISHLFLVDQFNRKPRLTCNCIKELDASTPLVNVSIEKGTSPKAMQFGAFLSRIIQQFWYANPADGPVWLSKWDILDTFHQCYLRLCNVDKFTYIMPTLPEDTYLLLCIKLVLPMGWVNSPYFFCSAYKTVIDDTNIYALDPDSTFVVYTPTDGTYKTSNGKTASTKRLQYVDIYMDDLLCAAQGDPAQQQCVSSEVKDSSRLKKVLAGDRDWAAIKETLGWVIGTNHGTLAMSSKRRLKLISLLDIPDS